MVKTLPPIGIGTSHPDATRTQTVESVRVALDVGFRHVDTAQLYGTESAVGEAIENSPVDRADVSLATKVEPGNLAAEDVIETTVASLERLRVDVVDLLYVHWPTESYDPEDTLMAFDELVDRGVVESIGVSNFNPTQLSEAIDLLDSPLVAHQVECHPLLPQRELREIAAEHGHRLVAHTPLGRGEILDHPTLRAVAAEHDVSTAQVALAWLCERDVLPVPKATSRAHVEDNYASTSLDLTDDDVARIDGIDDRQRFVDFDGAPWTGA